MRTLFFALVAAIFFLGCGAEGTKVVECGLTQFNPEFKHNNGKGKDKHETTDSCTGETIVNTDLQIDIILSGTGIPAGGIICTDGTFTPFTELYDGKVFSFQVVE